MIKRLRRQFGRPEYVPLRRPVEVQFTDIHCHCLPGLDDGPATLAESVALCRALVADGVRVVVATPHQMGRYEDITRCDVVRQLATQLNAELRAQSVNLDVLVGGDVRVDERLGWLLDEDKVLTIANGGKYILLELPHDAFIDVSPVLRMLEPRGVRAIITHPERHYVIQHDPDVVLPWLELGASLQVTAASLTGDFGQRAMQVGWHYVGRGLAAVVAGDAHDLNGRAPRMAEAYRLMADRLGESAANLLCVGNPNSVLAGRDMSAVDVISGDGGAR